MSLQRNKVPPVRSAAQRVAAGAPGGDAVEFSVELAPEPPRLGFQTISRPLSASDPLSGRETVSKLCAPLRPHGVILCGRNLWTQH